MKNFFFIILLFNTLIWTNLSHAVEKLPGTTWTFIPSDTSENNIPYQIQFYDLGKCKHIDRSIRCLYYLGYKNKLHLILNEYSISIGKINGNRISGNGSNQEGDKWKFTGVKIGDDYQGFMVE